MTARATGHAAFVAPALVLSFCVTLLPALLTIGSAFTEWDGVSAPSWAGLANFRDLFNDFAFWQAVFNNIRWTILFLTLPMAGALLVAALLRTRTRSQAAYQIILLAPYVVSPIANASIWTNIIFDPTSGMFGYLSRHGLAMPNPLGHPSTALYAVAAIDMWHFWGYLAVVFLAAIRQVPADQLDAAFLEGASGWQMFRHVTLPNIRPTVALMFVISTIFSFLTFDYVYLTTRGGPGFSTELLSILAYRLAFGSLEVGKAAAVAIVMSLFGLLASIVYVRLSRESLR